MANGPFADLSAYQRAAAQPVANPLESLIQGFQTGQAIQRLPQTIQEQEIMRQLNLALAQQKLQDVLNPNAALAREIQKQLTIKSFDPTSGIVRAPVGLEGETIGTPGALTQEQQQLLQVRDIAAEQGGVPLVIPRVAAGRPLTPIINIDDKPTSFIEDLESAITGTEALTRAKGTSALERLMLINAQAQQKQISQEALKREEIASREGIAAQANVTKKEVAEIRSKSRGGLTPFQQQKTLTDAALFGVDPDDPKYLLADGSGYDYLKIGIDKSKNQRQQKAEENLAKSQVLTGKTKSDYDALNAGLKQLDILQDEIEKIQQSGKEPSAWDDLVAVSVSGPPTGALNAIYQRILKFTQSDISKDLEDKKSIVSSALTKAISGAAVTISEDKRLEFLPRPGDSFKELTRKAAGLEIYLNQQKSGLSQGLTPSTGGFVPSPEFKASTGLIIKEIKQ